MEQLTQVCVNTPEYIAGTVGTVVIGVSALLNFVPAPDAIKNPVLKAVSRVLHFVAIDIVTAKKK